MNIAELDGRQLALWLTDSRDESAVFSGTIQWNGSALLLKRDPKPAFEIRSEWYERIQAITNDEVRKTLLGADYFLRLNIGDVPKGANPEEYEQTGLKWPE
jgi:hypothetical protein